MRKLQHLSYTSKAGYVVFYLYRFVLYILHLLVLANVTNDTLFPVYIFINDFYICYFNCFKFVFVLPLKSAYVEGHELNKGQFEINSKGNGLQFMGTFLFYLH